jgi:B12 binding protein
MHAWIESQSLRHLGSESAGGSPRYSLMVIARNGNAPRSSETIPAPLALTGSNGCKDWLPMRVKMILPALTEAKSPFFRPIKYSLFPPLGLATLAGFLDEDDDVSIWDEHVEKMPMDDEPDLVVIQAYITSARRSYAIADRYRARGVYVAIGGLHATSLPDEAQQHADTVFLGPGEDTWPRFLQDFRAGHPDSRYTSQHRTLLGVPPIRRDLIRRHKYLVPNSIVVSRGCPHVCDFCYKVAFFKGGKEYYVQPVDSALAEISRLPGRHLYFLDDHLFGSPPFAAALFDGMCGMGRLWQAAGTVKAVLEQPKLLEKAVRAGLRSLFVGFETVNSANLSEQRKFQNIGRDYGAAIRRLHELGAWSTEALSLAWIMTGRMSSTARSPGRSSKASRRPPSTS